jgi:hypothetical protein
MFDPTVGVEGLVEVVSSVLLHPITPSKRTRSARPQGPAYLVRYRVVLKERRTALLLSSYR